MKKTVTILLLIITIQMTSYGQQTFNDKIDINQLNSKYPSLNVTTRQGLFNGGHPHLYFLNTGGSATSPTSTPANRLLGTIIYSGFDGQSNVQIGRIGVTTTGDFTPGNYPARMNFQIGGTNTCCGVTRMTIDGETGNVGIGTSNTGSHRLAVEGSIGAREITVQTGTWSDFVFNDDYALPSLEEVENHIKEKGHLANIPSEKEVIRNGVNLGIMDAKLLQKIEELTIYIIEINKRVVELEKENSQLKNQN